MLGESFDEAVVKMNSVWNPFLRTLFTFLHSHGILMLSLYNTSKNNWCAN